jgi:hypothetical protein
MAGRRNFRMHTTSQKIFKNPVRTSKRTQRFTATKLIWLMLFEEINAVYSDNHTKPTNTKTLGVKLKLNVLLFHYQQYRTSTNLLNVDVNNALLLVVNILNIPDFKCEYIRVLSLFLSELLTFKLL